MLSFFAAYEKLKNPQNQKLYLKSSYNRDGWSFVRKIVKGKRSIIIPWVNAIEQTHGVFQWICIHEYWQC